MKPVLILVLVILLFSHWYFFYQKPSSDSEPQAQDVNRLLTRAELNSIPDLRRFNVTTNGFRANNIRTSRYNVCDNLVSIFVGRNFNRWTEGKSSSNPYFDRYYLLSFKSHDEYAMALFCEDLKGHPRIVDLMFFLKNKTIADVELATYVEDLFMKYQAKSFDKYRQSLIDQYWIDAKVATAQAKVFDNNARWGDLSYDMPDEALDLYRAHTYAFDGGLDFSARMSSQPYYIQDRLINLGEDPKLVAFELYIDTDDDINTGSVTPHTDHLKGFEYRVVYEFDNYKNTLIESEKPDPNWMSPDLIELLAAVEKSRKVTVYNLVTSETFTIDGWYGERRANKGKDFHDWYSLTLPYDKMNVKKGDVIRLIYYEAGHIYHDPLLAFSYDRRLKLY